MKGNVTKVDGTINQKVAILSSFMCYFWLSQTAQLCGVLVSENVKVLMIMKFVNCESIIAFAIFARSMGNFIVVL